MANIERLYQFRSVEEVSLILAKALELATKKPDLGRLDIQSELNVGGDESFIIWDWLADQNLAKPRLSNHWIRYGRLYVLNNPFPDLTEMGAQLKIGERRSYLVMQALEKKGIIRIRPDFSFERLRPMTSFAGLAKQMKRVAKKYRGRCEPELLVRTLFIDFATALRLSQYGEEQLGLRWKGRPSLFR